MEQACGGLIAERRDGDGLLAAHVEQLAARREHADAWTSREQRADEGRDRVDEVLAIVDDQQQLPRPELATDGHAQLLAAALADAQHLRGQRLDLISRGSGAECHEPDPVGECGEHRRGRLERQPSLSGAARTQQGHQAPVGQRFGDLDDGELAAYQPVRGRGKVVGSCAECSQ